MKTLKDEILKVIDVNLTVKENHQRCLDAGIDTSASTVYRYLKTLVEKKDVIRVKQIIALSLYKDGMTPAEMMMAFEKKGLSICYLTAQKYINYCISMKIKEKEEAIDKLQLYAKKFAEQAIKANLKIKVSC